MRAQGAIMALDIGERRIGVAVANPIAKIASPLTTLLNDHDTIENLQKLIKEHKVSTLVVGLPRGLNGQETAQTNSVRNFTADLEKQLNMPINFQDETLSSVRAEELLKASKKPFEKGAIDMHAAANILQDYLDATMTTQEKV